MESQIFFFALLAAGVIIALLLAARRGGGGLPDPNREPSARFDPQGAPQGWGKFRTVTTRDRTELEAVSEAAIQAQGQANADAALARALEAEARAAARAAELQAARARLRGQVLPPATEVVAAAAGGPAQEGGERTYTLQELRGLREILGAAAARQPRRG